MFVRFTITTFLVMSLLATSVSAENSTIDVNKKTGEYSDALNDAENTMTLYDSAISSIIDESKKYKAGNAAAVKDEVDKTKLPDKKRKDKKGSKEIADLRKKPLAAKIARKNKKKKNRHRNGRTAIIKNDSAKSQKNKMSNSASLKKGAVITDRMSPAVNKIADHFKERTGRNLKIYSGQRTPRMQANAIYGRIMKLGEIGVYHLYKNKAAISEVLNAYQDHRGNKVEAVDAMTKVLQRQVSKGTYLSRHMREGAIDVSKSSNRKALRNAVSQVNGTVLNEGDHFHIQFNVNG